MTLSRRGFLAGATASGGVALAAPAFAQTYPSAGPIRLIVPFGPAGPVDILARIIVDPLARQLGQSIVIENRGGAGGNIGIAAAARSKPDGYTLLLCSSTLVVNPLLYKSVPFDPYKDFVPISLLGTSPTLMLAKHEFAKGMRDFIAKAKAAPGKFNFSTPGIGTKGHFAVELLKLRAGIDIVHVPYPSGGQVTQSLLTGTTQLGSTALPAGEPLVERRHPRGPSGGQRETLAHLARRADADRARLCRLRGRDFHGAGGAGRHAARHGVALGRGGRQAGERPGGGREGRARRLPVDRRRTGGLAQGDGGGSRAVAGSD